MIRASAVDREARGARAMNAAGAAGCSIKTSSRGAGTDGWSRVRLSNAELAAETGFEILRLVPE